MHEIPWWKGWEAVCIVGAEGGNERHEFLEDITRDLSLRTKKGSISFMKNLLPRWRQYFKPFDILNHLEAPWISWSVHSQQVKKKGGEERKFAALCIVFLYMGSETFDISAYRLGDAENSKHLFYIFVPGKFRQDKSTNFTSMTSVSCDNGEMKFLQYHKYLCRIFML